MGHPCRPVFPYVSVPQFFSNGSTQRAAKRNARYTYSHRLFPTQLGVPGVPSILRSPPVWQFTLNRYFFFLKHHRAGSLGSSVQVQEVVQVDLCLRFKSGSTATTKVVDLFVSHTYNILKEVTHVQHLEGRRLIQRRSGRKEISLSYYS
jgi:hypothetical protein